MRNLILILALTLAALASTSAFGMGMDRIGGTMPGDMASMDGHACPACPDDAMGDPGDHAACGDCAACGAIGRNVPHPSAGPVAMTFSRVEKLPVAPLPASRIDIDDPPPPRA